MPKPRAVSSFGGSAMPEYLTKFWHGQWLKDHAAAAGGDWHILRHQFAEAQDEWAAEHGWTILFAVGREHPPTLTAAGVGCDASALDCVRVG